MARYQTRVLAAMWLTYGSFYFCRVNISPANALIMADLGISKEAMGLVLGGGKLAYAIGQLVNGQLANRLSPRRMLAVGMAASAVLNVLFGFAAGYSFLLFVWFLNGFAQSMGWTPMVKVMTHWFPADKRGRAMGILGTCYQVSTALTLWGVGELVVALESWRVAFWIPAGLVLGVMVLMLVMLKDRPEDVGLESPPQRDDRRRSVREAFREAAGQPVIWLFGLVLATINIVRYGFLDWAPVLLKEVQGVGIASAALKTAIIPLGGVVGAMAAGWISDRFFASRRAPVTCAMLVMLAALTWIAEPVIRTGSFAGTLVLLTLVGAMIYGPQVMVVGALPQDFFHRAVAAGAAGLINSLGYAGAFLGDVVTGSLSHRLGWGAALTFWSGTAIASALLMSLLWSVRPRDATPRAGDT